MPEATQKIVIVNNKGLFFKNIKYEFKQKPFTNKKENIKQFSNLENAQFFLEIHVNEPDCKVVYLDEEGKIYEIGHKIENSYKLVS